MSLYILVFIVVILTGTAILVVIFSLLSAAQRGDAYLEQMSLIEAAGRGESFPAKSPAAPVANSLPEEVCRDSHVVSRTS